MSQVAIDSVHGIEVRLGVTEKMLANLVSSESNVRANHTHEVEESASHLLKLGGIGGASKFFR
jgi:hypothetical protein